MTVAMIVHVEGDRSYVDSLQSKLEGVRLIACLIQPDTPVMAFDARLPLILVWSANAAAEAAERSFSALGRVHLGQTILCRVDNQPLPGCLSRLRASVVDGSPKSSLFPGGFLAALTEARRRQLFAQAARPPQRLDAPVNIRRAFAQGVTRGLAGGVAVFGVGSAAALSIDTLPEAEPHNFATDAYDDGATAAATVDSEDWTAPTVVVVEPTPRSVRATPDVDADVPLALPGPAEMAAQQAASFVTDRPLEVWTPDASLAPLQPVADLGDIASPSR